MSIRIRKILEGWQRCLYILGFILFLPKRQYYFLAKVFRESKSQLGQDLLVLSVLNLKRDGYFVEFGATNGVDLSNTYLLEKSFGWNGIVAEPALCWHERLKKNRSCHIETKCVWSESGCSIRFNEVENAEYSTVDTYSSRDMHEEKRRFGRYYDVETISLNTLLEKYDAPRSIDYLSIDTEGSELQILNSLDFEKYQFKVITCEHNYTRDRKKILTLLENHGYERKFRVFSRVDDWYVKSNL